MLKLEVKNLAKWFGTRKIFEDIDFSLEPGRSIAIVGPNGSGKTTLLTLIMGLSFPTMGRVAFYRDGRKLDFDKYRRSLALVAPYMALYGSLTAAENMRFLLKVDGRSAADSEIEEVRYQAVHFLGYLAGRSVIQALRAKVFDPSDRISIEALEGLVGQSDGGATRLRMPDYDIIAAKGVDAGLIVKTSGRPLIAVTGIGTPLAGTIEAVVGDVALGSTDENHVGVFKGIGPEGNQVVVEATMDNILATFANFNVPFETARRILVTLEDAGNMPYRVTWID